MFTFSEFKLLNKKNKVLPLKDITKHILKTKLKSSQDELN